MDLIARLPGMHDAAGPAWRRLHDAQAALRDLFARHGYQVVDTPVLEPTELFLRKSGGELAARMYTFQDPGGRQSSLRPEFTSSVVRHLLEHRKEVVLPWRVQYAGPVFRYDADGPGPRQFTQAGAELLGSSHPRADAEVLDLAWQGLAHLGISGHRLVVGDTGVFTSLCEAVGLSERGRLFVLGSLTTLREGDAGLEQVRQHAERLGLLRADVHTTGLRAVVTAMRDEEARELLRELYAGVAAGPWGGRTPDEILARHLRKLRGGDDPSRLERVLRLAARLVQVRGAPQQVLRKAAAIVQEGGLDHGPLDRLQAIARVLQAHQDLPVALDFGLVRGIAYYTGIVFELQGPDGASLGGGGRYDGLARALGSPQDVPALGFAYTLERVLGVAHESNGAAAPTAAVLVAPRDAAAYAQALQVARRLREQGAVVEMEVQERTDEERLSYAQVRGLGEIVMVDAGGRTYQQHVARG